MYVEFTVSQLQNTRARQSRGEETAVTAIERLTADANATLAGRAPRVTDKPAPGPSGDVHDFYSVGKYSWANPESADGMPWIRRDCLINPDIFTEEFDKARWDRLIDGIRTLVLGWYFTGEDRYAEGAALWLRTWFADPATRMSPHLQHCAAQPGVHDGMSSGIIEGAVIPELLDYVAVLARAPAYTADLHRDLQGWMQAYAEWVRTSAFGLDEQARLNNHGSWRTAQLAAIARFSGEGDPTHTLQTLSQLAIAHQISTDGSLPAEMRRPNSWLYATYGLRALFSCAQTLSTLGHDLWGYRTADERHLRSAFDFLLPYLCGDKTWNRPLVEQEMDDHSVEYALRLAQAAYIVLGDSRALRAIDRLEETYPEVDYRILVLLDPRPMERENT